MPKKNKRKYAAVALGILGVAGMSLAAAAQLTVNSDEIAVGSDVFAACDTVINVGYTTGAFAHPNLAVDEIVVSDVAAACNGRAYTLSILNAAGVPIEGQEYTGTASTGSFPIEALNLNANVVHGVVLVIE